MSFFQLFHKLRDDMSDKKIKKELELNQSILVIKHNFYSEKIIKQGRHERQMFYILKNLERKSMCLGNVP